MDASSAPSSARSDTTPKSRARSNWQRASFSAAKRPNSGGRNSFLQRGAQRSMSLPRPEEALASENETEEPETKKTRAELEIEVEALKASDAHAKSRVQELEGRCGDLSRKYRAASSEAELTKDRLNFVEKENKRISKQLSTTKGSLDSTKSRLTNMEWKAMEYEKLSILNDNLKTKNENLRQDNRDLERRVQMLEKELEETQRKLEEKQKEVNTVDERMKDLRLQVREENIKNIQLDQKVEELQNAKVESAEKESVITELRRRLDESELKVEHARRSWREERDKVVEYERNDKGEESMRGEVEIVRAENLTLKKINIAKDRILIQKTRMLDNIKNRLIKSRNQNIDVEVLLSIMESKPEIQASFPNGHKLKQEQFGDGDVQVNGWTDESPRSTRQSSPRREFLRTVLYEDDTRNNNTQPRSQSATERRPKTAIVKPNNYKSQSFVNFRSSSEGFMDTNQANNNNKDSNTEHDRSNRSSTPKVRRGHSIREKQAPKSKALENQESKLRRTKSLENKMRSDPPEMYRSVSPSGWSSTRASSTSISTVGSTGSYSIPAIMLKQAPTKDRAYSRVVRNGDRVCVDMARHKEKRRQNFQQGVIKFIGNIDKQHDCYKIYVGIKLDESVGDTDGLYKGKRYFKVSSNHGKFVHVTRITAVQNRQSLRFQGIEELLKKNSDCTNDKEPASSEASYELNL